LKIRGIALVLLLSIMLGSGLACHVGEEPSPDPTPPPLGDGDELPEAYQYTRTWSDGVETIVMHVWVKDGKSRADWNLYESPPGKNEKIKFIDDGEYKWIYDVDEHWAARYQTRDTVHQVEEHMLWFSENYYGSMPEAAILSEMQAACAVDPQCSGVEITGHETINGQSGTQFTYSASNGAAIVYWISNGGWLVQVVTTDATDYSVTMRYEDVDLNPGISDDVFDMEKLAPGALITDMTAS
jgi:hypothetical protein